MIEDVFLMPSLSKLNASAYEYQCAVSDQFRKICQPIFDLGIKYFSYYRIFNDGTYLALQNHEEYTKQYFSNILNNGVIFTNQLDFAPSLESYHFFLPSDLTMFSKAKDPIMFLLYEFDIWNQISFYKHKGNNSVECYNFAMTKADIHAFQFYKEYFPLLEHFILYFQERAKELINCNDKRRLAYFQQEFDFSQNCPQDFNARKIEQFLQATRLKHLKIHGKHEDINLAPREIDCLHYLALGKSVKEIGRILEISPRTVEFYLRNAKQRTGYHTKTELIAEFNRHHPMAFQMHI
jgi:DNA-binding CsgD family transcriptional regulator